MSVVRTQKHPNGGFHFGLAIKPPFEAMAKAKGWFPTREAHIMFRNSTGVCRHLGKGDSYNSDTDSYMSVPLRHAENWEEACVMDRLS